jgi:hypothetical protein
VKKFADKVDKAHKTMEKGPSVDVGIMGSKALAQKKTREKRSFDRDGGFKSSAPNVSLVEVAHFHEYGVPSRNIPERSFLRATIRKNHSEYKKFLEKAVTQIYLGKLTVKQSLALLGEKAVSNIRTRIIKHIPPPLQPETIWRKQSTTPLIDTGQLLNSITYKVNADTKKK